jgi:hypothetical protein
MAARWVVLLLVFLAALFFFLSIAGIAAIMHRKTQPLGILLLGVPLALGVLVLGMVLIRYLAYREPIAQQPVLVSKLPRLPAIPPPPWSSEHSANTAAKKDVAAKKDTPAKKDSTATAPGKMGTISESRTTRASSPDRGNETSVPAPSPAATTPPPAPLKRPDWVDAQPGKVGDGYQMVAAVGPYTTRLECDEALPDQLQKTTAEYVELYLGAEAQGRATLADDYLRQHVVKEKWEETKSTSVGPMIQLHARLLFDAKANEQLKQNWRDAQVRDRLWLAGRWLAAVLAVLMGMWAILKTESAAEGTHRDRPATVLAMRLGLVVLVVVAVALVLLV